MKFLEVKVLLWRHIAVADTAVAGHKVPAAHHLEEAAVHMELDHREPLEEHRIAVLGKAVGPVVEDLQDIAGFDTVLVEADLALGIVLEEEPDSDTALAEGLVLDTAPVEELDPGTDLAEAHGQDIDLVAVVVAAHSCTVPAADMAAVQAEDLPDSRNTGHPGRVGVVVNSSRS